MPNDELVDRLRAAGCVFAEDEARLLREAATAPEQREELVVRRIAGEPLEQLLGWAEFAGLRILLEPGVFVPRTRTELLARRAAGFARDAVADRPEPTGSRAERGDEPRAVVLDLCCGAGAIGAAVHHAVPGIELVAADLDPAAVTAARRNLEPLDAFVLEGDLFAPLPERLRARIDVIAVNAPYVPSEAIELMPHEARDHEHRIALDGGADGLELHRRIAADAGEWLAPRGRLVIECSRAQSTASAALFEAAGFEASVEVDDDLDGTVVVVRRPAAG